jgi:hypothetical protein
MSLVEIINRINKIEDIKDIVNFRLKGIDLWPTLRVNIYGKIYASVYAEKRNIKPIGSYIKYVFDKIYRKLLFAVNIFKNFDISFLNLAKVDILFLSDGVSFVSHGKYYIDKLCYPIDEYLTSKKYKTTTIIPEYIDKNIISKQSVLHIEPLISLLSLWFKFRNPVNRDERCKVNNIISKINDDLGGEYLVASSLLSSVNHLMINIVIFKYLLKKSKPSVVFVVEFYSTQGQAMAYACKSLGIKCIDLQHGTTYDTHPAYTHWDNAPINSYNTLPEGFFVWSHTGKELIKKWYNGNVYWGTNIYLDQYISEESDQALNSKDKTDYDSEKYKELLDRKCKKIIVTLQTGIFTVDQIYFFLRNNVWMQEYCWLVRLHPCMLDQVESAKAILSEFENVELECASKNILYDVLKISDLHITYCSSTTLEAALFSVPSILLDNSGVELCQTHIPSEYYEYTKGLHNLTDELIKSVLKKEIKNIKHESKKRLQRAYEAIDDIMNDCVTR